MYYSIVEKITGKMPNGISNYCEDEHPIADDSLCIVPLSSKLEELLTTPGPHSETLDLSETYYDFNLSDWVVIIQQPETKDILTERTEELTTLLTVANNKLAISDMPQVLKDKITTYINILMQIDLETTVDPDFTWPTAPF